MKRVISGWERPDIIKSTLNQIQRSIETELYDVYLGEEEAGKGGLKLQLGVQTEKRYHLRKETKRFVGGREGNIKREEERID